MLNIGEERSIERGRRGRGRGGGRREEEAGVEGVGRGKGRGGLEKCVGCGADEGGGGEEFKRVGTDCEGSKGWEEKMEEGSRRDAINDSKPWRAQVKSK